MGALDINGTVSRADDAVAWYSSRGPTWYDGFQKPDLVAPDSHLVSDVSTASTIYNTYPRGALLVNGKPAVKAILQYTALPVANADTLTQGAGAVNAAGAIALAAAIDPNRPVGAWWLTTGVNTWTTIGGQTLAWGQRAVWGDQIIWHRITRRDNWQHGHLG